jgi:hypothetical protein
LTMKDCWIEDKAFQQDYMILSAIDVSAYKEELSASSYRTVLTIAFIILYIKFTQVCWKMLIKD